MDRTMRVQVPAGGAISTCQRPSVTAELIAVLPLMETSTLVGVPSVSVAVPSIRVMMSAPTVAPCSGLVIETVGASFADCKVGSGNHPLTSAMMLVGAEL